MLRALVPGLVLLLLAVVAVLAVRPGGGDGPVVASCRVRVDGAEVRLDPEQARHAATIAAVGRRLGLPDHAVTVAYATALQESRLHNLPYGDRDSLGLFQQRPSQGWGTAAQVQVPVYAATAFFRRLAEVPGWAQLPVTVAAQAVQRSGFPEAYARHEGQARLMARAYTGQVPAALTCRGAPAPVVLRADALREAARAELGRERLDRTPEADLWLTASWLVARAQDLGVSEVVVAGQRWTAAGGVWAPYASAAPGVAYG